MKKNAKGQAIAMLLTGFNVALTVVLGTLLTNAIWFKHTVLGFQAADVFFSILLLGILSTSVLISFFHHHLVETRWEMLGVAGYKMKPLSQHESIATFIFIVLFSLAFWGLIGILKFNIGFLLGGLYIIPMGTALAIWIMMSGYKYLSIFSWTNFIESRIEAV